MSEIDFNKLDQAFDKMCVKATRSNPTLAKHATELLVFAEHHPNRPLVLQNLRRELKVHYNKRKSYKSHERFKQNAQLIILTVAEMFMHAIKAKRDQDNLSTLEKLKLQQGNQLKNDVAQLIREVPRGSTEERD